MHGIALTFTTALWACLVNAKELSELEALASKPTRCTYETAYEMYGAHCVGLKLTQMPYLKSGIEILDLTDNKLKEISADTFSSYTSIKFLYLADNAIYHIDEEAFTSLTSLQTLDLSLNVIQMLPISILNTPSLRNLYLSGNPLVTLDVDVKALSKPIKAPLEQLDLSNCRLSRLPDFGLLPQLKVYNISQNPLRSLETYHFANTCNLAKIDLTNSIDLIKHCDLRPTITWFEEKRIYFQLEDYSRLNSKEFESCHREEISPTLNATHKNCKSEYLEVQTVKTSRSKWLTIIGGLVGFLVAFILLLYVMHRWNVAQTTKPANIKTVNDQVPLHDDDKRAMTALLNNVT